MRTIFLITFFISMLSVGTVATARVISITGTISNLVSKNVFPVVRVYLPGHPFFGSDVKKEFQAVASTSYDQLTGKYTVQAEVPDGQAMIIIGATYRDENTEIIKEFSVGSGDAIRADLALPDNAQRELGFVFKLYYEGQEYDYSRSYSCMVVSTSSTPEGRLMLFSFYDAGTLKNEFYNLPPSEYTFACSIVNLGGGVPHVLRRYKNIKIPLTDNNGQILPETSRIVKLKFGATSSDGIQF